MARPSTIVISDWLANCRAGQWTPFEAATALKAALTKEGYAIVPVKPSDEMLAELARIGDGPMISGGEVWGYMLAAATAFPNPAEHAPARTQPEKR